MTHSNSDLRLWARIAILALIATALGAVIAAPWLGLLIIFAIAMSRRGQLLLLGPHARPHRQPATRRSDAAPGRERTRPHARRGEHADVRTRGGRANNEVTGPASALERLRSLRSTTGLNSAGRAQLRGG